jgi:hypothetical protein
LIRDVARQASEAQWQTAGPPGEPYKGSNCRESQPREHHHFSDFAHGLHIRILSHLDFLNLASFASMPANSSAHCDDRIY